MLHAICGLDNDAAATSIYCFLLEMHGMSFIGTSTVYAQVQTQQA